VTNKPGILLVAPPDSYRVAPYIAAARQLDVAITIASRGEHSLVNEIAEGIHINLGEPHEAVKTIISSAEQYNIKGIVAADDKVTEIVALAASSLGLPHNPPDAVHLTRWKHKARTHLRNAGLPVPDHWVVSLTDIQQHKIPDINFPCVVKPVNLSASRGVIRCDNIVELIAAVEKISAIIATLDEPEARNLVLIEKFISGNEYAIEAILQDGKLIPIAVFDKPDPLQGPYFEETYYVTPSQLSFDSQRNILEIIEKACAAYGLVTGPVHAEVRLDGNDVYIIEIAARTIGGECARLVEFASNRSLESIVIEYAMGNNTGTISLESAAGVMMIPTPRSGVLRRVEGVLEAQKIKNIKAVNISIREGHELIALPEGASYLGFIFATANSPKAVESALRDAFEKLNIVINPLWKIGGHPV